MCYFNQSEQLRTFIHLTNTETRVAGFLIQQMPNEETFEENPDVWETLQILAKTISNEELIDLQSKELLNRLFHEFDLQLNSSDKVEFCMQLLSRKDSGNSLSKLILKKSYRY